MKEGRKAVLFPTHHPMFCYKVVSSFVTAFMKKGEEKKMRTFLKASLGHQNIFLLFTRFQWSFMGSISLFLFPRSAWPCVAGRFDHDARRRVRDLGARSRCYICVSQVCWRDEAFGAKWKRSARELTGRCLAQFLTQYLGLTLGK